LTNQPSHSLIASRIDLFSELNVADLGEFSIRSQLLALVLVLF